MPESWSRHAHAITTSESRADIAWSRTIAGSTPRRSSSRKIRSAMFSTICTWTHEWSDMPSRVASVCCMCHHALTCASSLAAASSASSRRLPRAGARMRIASIAAEGVWATGGTLAEQRAQPGEHRRGVERPRAGAVGDGVEAGQLREHGGVPRVDAVDREDDAQEVGRVDRRELAEARRGAEVLDRECVTDEAVADRQPGAWAPRRVGPRPARRAREPRHVQALLLREVAEARQRMRVDVLLDPLHRQQE